nr:hypothetical protein [uncultured Caproiciproducens sp.]
MRVKNLLAVCAVVLFAGLTACGVENTSVLPSSQRTPAVSGLEEIPQMTAYAEIRVIDGDMLYAPTTLKEEDKLSDYIVKGRLLDDAKQKLERYEPGTVNFGVTVSSFKISWVYKGNLNIGDIIPIAERYYTVEEKGKIVRYELGYAPSPPDKEYIFFLSKVEDSNEFLRGTYTPSVKETARYPVVDPSHFDVDSMTAEQLNLVVRNVEDYRGIYKEVIRKFMR